MNADQENKTFTTEGTENTEEDGENTTKRFTAKDAKGIEKSKTFTTEDAENTEVDRKAFYRKGRKGRKGNRKAIPYR